MSNICSNCQFFRKENIVVEGTSIQQNTYIDKKDPNDEGASILTIAQCSNEATTNEIITRDTSTNWFFSDSKYFNIVNNQIVICGQNDNCENFQAKT